MLQAKSFLLPSSGHSRAGLGGGAWTVFAVSVLALIFSVWMYPYEHWVLVATASLTLMCLSLGYIAVWSLRDRADTRAFENLRDMMAWDKTPTFITDAEGNVVWRNTQAELIYQSKSPSLLSDLLTTQLADPRKLLSDMRARAMIYRHVTETRTFGAKAMHLSVMSDRQVWFLWRIEVTESRHARDIDSTGLPVMRLDPSDRLVAANEAMVDLLGTVAAEPGKTLRELRISRDGAHKLSLDDGMRQMHVHQVPRDGGRDVYLFPSQGVGVQDDRELFETLPVPLVKLNAGGEIVLANRGARILLEDEIRPGRLLSELVSGLGRSVTDWLQDAIEGRGLNRSEFLQVTKQTKDVFVQVTLKRLPDEDDAELVAVLNDATELKTLEAQFVQSQKMQAIGQLAGGVAHDFNNLLTAISGHCDLLLLRHDQGDPEYADLVQIHQNTNRAASLVGQLLAFSRKQTLQPEVVDLRDTLSELTHLLNRLVGEKITLTLTHDAKLSAIRADKRQLEQVIMNLVVNSRDAMGDGGEIRIETEAQVLDREVKRNRAAIPAGAYSVVKVIDHGVGISPDKVTKVFEPFYTTKRTGEGTGLGLSTAYGIVKQTGGFIFVESEPGVGTTFILYFPAHVTGEPVPVAVEEVPEVDADAQGAGVVLLVEDEAPVRAFASRALRLRGYTVLEADSAEQALETLEDEELVVDVFVTDVVMPGMDGPSWVRKALEVRPDTRVVFVSGYAEDALADHKSRIPHSVFLPKPFSLNDLTKVVQSQFKSRLH